MKKHLLILLVSCILPLSFSCTVFRQIENISRLKFRLNSIDNFKIMGVDISNKNSVRDFNFFDTAKFLNGIKQGSLNVSFNVNIDALNPNDGGGYPKQNLDIVDFKWRLFIDDKETINGNISRPISVPGKGEAITFAIAMELDLYKFFREREFDALIDLALKLGGLGGSPHRVTVKANPTIKSIFGKLSYPGEINIVNREFH